MSRKVFTALLILFSAGILVSGCNPEDREEVYIPGIGGMWDLILLPEPGDAITYKVTVSTGGGSNVAEVTTRTSEGDIFGPDLVQSGTPVALGPCGVEITFSTVNGLDLVQGDYWTIRVSQGRIYNPYAAPGNTSLVDQVTSGGVYTCSAANCPGGLMAIGTLPSAFGQPDLMSGHVEFPGFEVVQEDANFSGAVPEIHVLSLTLVGHKVGDEITLSYHRRINWDGDGGDFFFVRVMNGDRMLKAEYSTAADSPEPDSSVSGTFVARSRGLRVDFIFGLSSATDRIRLDEVRERVNGTVMFSDNFADVTFQDDLPGDVSRWEARSPGFSLGSLGISADRPLEGAYSVLAEGGWTRNLSGSILASRTVLGLGLLSGLSDLGQGGFPQTDPEQGDTSSEEADTTEISNVTFSIFEGGRGEFYSSFGGALEGENLIAGTFSGEEGDFSCMEEGQFFAAINTELLVQAGGIWTLELAGDAESCGGVGQFTQVLGPFRVTQSGEWFSSDPASPVTDDYGNQYTLQGRAIETMLYFVLGDYTMVLADTATFAGLQGDERIVGAFGGGMFFENGRACDVTGSFNLTID